MSHPVTASEFEQSGTNSVRVTRPMLCHNRMVFCYTRDDGRLGWFYPRWIPVQAWSDEAGKHWAMPPKHRGCDEPWRVYMRRCYRCHQDYPSRHGAPWYCGDCERRHKTAVQRAGRARRRAIPPAACAQCASTLPATVRLSRRYCSGRCRVAAFRQRERNGKRKFENENEKTKLKNENENETQKESARAAREQA